MNDGKFPRLSLIILGDNSYCFKCLKIDGADLIGVFDDQEGEVDFMKSNYGEHMVITSHLGYLMKSFDNCLSFSVNHLQIFFTPN